MGGNRGSGWGRICCGKDPVATHTTSTTNCQNVRLPLCWCARLFQEAYSNLMFLLCVGVGCCGRVENLHPTVRDKSRWHKNTGRLLFRRVWEIWHSRRREPSGQRCESILLSRRGGDVFRQWGEVSWGVVDWANLICFGGEVAAYCGE